MACTTDHRRGALLIIVAGLLAILAALATAFFIRVRAEAARSRLVEQTAQARLMVNAALLYLQEASRIGWAPRVLPGDDAATAAVKAADHYGAARIGVGDPPGYPSYPDGLVPAKGDFWRPPTVADGWNGDYQTGGPPAVASERSWVGWFSPVHRGLFKDFWANVEWENGLEARQPANRAWTVQALAGKPYNPGTANYPGKTYREVANALHLGAAGYEARIRSEPIPPNGARSFRDPWGAVAPPADWAAAPWTSDARYRIRAELTDAWPVGGPPKLFPMHRLERPPFAIIPLAAAVSTWHLKQSGGAYYANRPWAYPVSGEAPAADRIAGTAAPLPDFQSEFPGHRIPGTAILQTSWRPFRRDPPIRDPATWLQGDPRPVAASMNIAWFRIYRESADTFIITAGAGPTMGFSLRHDGAVETSTDAWTPGSPADVVSPLPCPFASPAELRLAMSEEVRVWFRATWNPGTSVKRSLPTSMGCAQAGTFSMIQRLRERELGPPSLRPAQVASSPLDPLRSEAERLRALPVNASAPEAVCPTW